MGDLILVTIDDIRQIGHCVAGARQWFGRHQIPFKEGLKSGWSSDVLLATGDPMAVKAVAQARGRLARG